MCPVGEFVVYHVRGCVRYCYHSPIPPSHPFPPFHLSTFPPSHLPIIPIHSSCSMPVTPRGAAEMLDGSQAATCAASQHRQNRPSATAVLSLQSHSDFLPGSPLSGPVRGDTSHSARDANVLPTVSRPHSSGKRAGHTHISHLAPTLVVLYHGSPAATKSVSPPRQLSPLSSHAPMHKTSARLSAASDRGSGPVIAYMRPSRCSRSPSPKNPQT